MTQVEVVFDSRHHTVDAIQRAAYRLSDRLTVDIIDNDRNIVCRLTTRDADAEANELASLFRVEVLDQVLRERIREETRDVRNLVLALAFSNADLDEHSADA